MLENLIASVIKEICNISNIDTVYFDEIEDGFISPSIYVPPAEQTPQGDTLTSFRFDTAIYFKIYAKTTKEAVALAEIVVMQIVGQKNIINILNKDGSKTGKTFRIKSISSRKADTAIAQVYISFQTIFPYIKETYSNAQQIIWNTKIK